MTGFLEKFRNKTVHFLFPFIERFYPFIALVLLVAAWSIPEAYWSVRVILMWFWLVNSEIYYVGIMERDHLPIRSGNGVFYRVYSFLDIAVLLFLLFWLIFILLPGISLQAKARSSIVIVAAWILRAIGDHKYRPKKPEE